MFNIILSSWLFRFIIPVSTWYSPLLYMEKKVCD